MTQKNTSPDQLISTVIAGIEDVKGKDITKHSLRLLYYL
jgi:ribosome-associated protein